MAQERGAAALAPLVRSLGTNVRVLMIAAHPDDEDTQLLTWLARGRGVETAYLALTRGDGGQNIIGNELGEPLGAIRTEELLAARRMDGARQYFTRAFDFGFSKNAEETLTQWSRDSVFRDVVTVVRAFRPHVIVSVFSGTPADGHGHHQVAGILARDAYDLSADTVRFPRSATAGLGPWTVSKFYRGAFFRNQSRATIRVNVGEFDPVTGRSYAEVAADSRSQHKSQAMGALQPRGARFDQLEREATRVGPADASSERSIFDGIDTTWARFRTVARTPAQRAALDSLAADFAAARASLDLLRPASVVPALARLQRTLLDVCRAAPADNPCDAPTSAGRDARTGDLRASMEVARGRVEQALALASGVAIEVTAARDVWAVGEPFRAAWTAYNRGTLPVRLTRRELLVPGADSSAIGGDARAIAPDSALRDSVSITMLRTSQPWWLERARQGPMFAMPARPDDEAAQSSSPSVISFFDVEGASFRLTTPATWRFADPVRGEVNRPVVAAPAITLTLSRAVEYAPASTPIQRTIDVEVRSHSSEAREAEVRLALPPGLVADSASRRVSLTGQRARSNGAGTSRTVTFTLRGQLAAGRHEISAMVTSGGTTFTTGYSEVAYDHIHTQRLYRPATLAINAVDLRLPRSAVVGYIAGVGDNIAPVLQQLGLDVTVLDPAALPRADLSRFTSIVVGTRAYEAHPALVANNARLLDYARNGGTLVVQYGQYEMTQPGIMPYPITLARPADRVTVEAAPVTILDPAAPVLNAPNRITAKDFDGWVQDRSLYSPRTFDAAYTPLLELHDPSEPENRGALLVAPLGRGTYVYTTLAFFRQLPNGVPGAARLFVNLLGAGAARIAQ
ncbi:MAG: PIG-L family deacetylase [Gemmatimonadaceae bacterium]|nr:PIG-L family deacetylase [Gemmatimonadaceae bacterium]